MSCGVPYINPDWQAEIISMVNAMDLINVYFPSEYWDGLNSLFLAAKGWKWGEITVTTVTNEVSSVDLRGEISYMIWADGIGTPLASNNIVHTPSGSDGTLTFPYDLDGTGTPIKIGYQYYIET